MKKWTNRIYIYYVIGV